MATKGEAGMLLTFHPWTPGSHSAEMSRTWPTTCVQTVLIYGSEYTLQVNINLSSILVWKGNIFTADYKDSETHSVPRIALNYNKIHLQWREIKWISTSLSDVGPSRLTSLLLQLDSIMTLKPKVADVCWEKEGTGRFSGDELASTSPLK